RGIRLRPFLTTVTTTFEPPMGMEFMTTDPSFGVERCAALRLGTSSIMRGSEALQRRRSVIRLRIRHLPYGPWSDVSVTIPRGTRGTTVLIRRVSGSTGSDAAVDPVRKETVYEI